MKLEELVEALDNRYGNPLHKGNELILEAIKELHKVVQRTKGDQDENCNGKQFIICSNTV